MICVINEHVRNRNSHVVKDDLLEIHAVILPSLHVDSHNCGWLVTEQPPFCGRHSTVQRDLVRALRDADIEERLVVNRDADLNKRRGRVRAELERE